ncbi:YihY/virulence factor BrkB family protein [Ligilactobacillus equi]|nr:YihY/virulence factor BrkB family protein [Ligilactobacillus equi]MCQ2556440.1 YihY/virulence factor BrkB family protein [Ligilactobacillus sp.]
MKVAFRRFKDSFTKFVKIFVERFTDSDINNIAIVIAYYTLLAMLPLLIVVGNILPMINLSATTILAYIQPILPKTIYRTIAPLIKTFLTQGSGGIASVSGLVALWAVSRGINAINVAFNRAYGVGRKQSPLVTRLLSFLFTILIGVLIFILFVTFSFGQVFLENVAPIFNLPSDWLATFLRLRMPTATLVIFITFCILYRLLPNAKIHFVNILPGAFLATLSWLLISQLFSYYITYIARSVLSYGTIGTFIVLMFWLNFTCWAIIFGAVVNATFEYWRFGEVKTRTHRWKTYLHRKIKNTKKSASEK